jgi:hypothetical protein
MKIEFTKEEVEKIILDHANALVQTGDKPFNKIECSYSYIPSTLSVVHEEPKDPS